MLPLYGKWLLFRQIRLLMFEVATCCYCKSSNARVTVTHPLSVRHRRLDRSWRSHTNDLGGVASCMTRVFWWKRASVRATAHGSSTGVESHLSPASSSMWRTRLVSGVMVAQDNKSQSHDECFHVPFLHPRPLILDY